MLTYRPALSSSSWNCFKDWTLRSHQPILCLTHRSSAPTKTSPKPSAWAIELRPFGPEIPGLRLLPRQLKAQALFVRLIGAKKSSMSTDYRDVLFLSCRTSAMPLTKSIAPTQMQAIFRSSFQMPTPVFNLLRTLKSQADSIDLCHMQDVQLYGQSSHARVIAIAVSSFR
jgi:hypothetical protein